VKLKLIVNGNIIGYSQISVEVNYYINFIYGQNKICRYR